jgi:hypothetical protein
VLFIVGLAFELGGWTSRPLAIACFVLAGLLAVAACVWSPGVRQQLPVRLEWCGPTLRQREAKRVRALFRSHADRAGQEAGVLGQHIVGAVRISGSVLTGALLELGTLQPTERARARLASLVDRRVPRSGWDQALVDFYGAYQMLIYYLEDAAHDYGHSLVSDGNFHAWHNADAGFMNGLHEIVSTTTNRKLEQGIKRSGWPDGSQRTPRYPPEVEGSV